MPKEQWHTSGERVWRLLKPEARRMRHAPTEAEEVMWQHLRKRGLGVRFRRQHAIDRFIVDFCCLKAKLVVEVDGKVHRISQEQDKQRDDLLSRMGYRVVRFSNEIVLNDIESVLGLIRQSL